MNQIISLQGAGERVSIRTALINARMWNVQQLAAESGVDPIEVAAVLYNQVASGHAVYQLMTVLNNTEGAGSWIMK